MAELAANPADSPSSHPDGTGWERRLRAEWSLLEQLTALNPDRLADPSADDTILAVRLFNTPAVRLNGTVATTHRLRLDYPRFFPSTPLALRLEEPVLHPNVHPQTGFLCLWDTHRIAYTVEHAIHKTAAMLGWRLLNLDPRHVMQADAAALASSAHDRLARELRAPALIGIRHPAEQTWVPANPQTRRRRLL